MPYCTLDDIKARRIPESTLVALTDDDNAGIVDETVVTDTIADADELIDGYLRGHYLLPLDSVPGLIKLLAADVTAYNLYGRRAEFEIPKSVSEKYSNALKVLDKIQRGEIKLGSAGLGTAPAEDTSESLQVSAPARMFDNDTLDRY